jgi:hypothetical protein
LLSRRRTSFHHSSRAGRNADLLAVRQGDNRAMSRCPHDRRSLDRHCPRLPIRAARWANDPRLSICRRLPASDANLRLSKERIHHRFELSLREVTRRRSVILAEIVDDSVPAEPEPISEDLRSVSRFALAAGKNAAHLFDPNGGCHCAHTCSTARIEWPIGNRNAQFNHDIRVGDEKNRRHGVEGQNRVAQS